MKYKPKKRKQKPEPTYLEQLEAENAFLKMENAFLKKVQRLDSAGRGRRKTQKTALIISELRAEYPLKKLLDYTGMAKSTYYAAMKSINKGDKYSKLKEAIKRICIDNKGRYGYRLVTLKLKNEGFNVNHRY